MKVTWALFRPNSQTTFDPNPELITAEWPSDVPLPSLVLNKSSDPRVVWRNSQGFLKNVPSHPNRTYVIERIDYFYEIVNGRVAVTELHVTAYDEGR